MEENSVGNAAAALMAKLAPKTKVLRDRQWSEQDASILGDPLKIDQSALTGESLPVTKKPADEVFSGVHTFFKKATHLVDSTNHVGHFQKEIPEKSEDSEGGPWKFCGLLPLFDPPRHDSAETISKALNLGVNGICLSSICAKVYWIFISSVVATPSQ
ncbi:hypothetical protein GOP47_0008656 [Adiantum capillus-veneris]|uniref:P-type ATPase A domain-containing protein n=1 Tax=Adiantum capillus-veneris TaxID=13818 RepID=A0A9D4UYT1_ADICA|nr:hypothetical protein GOP47_0008656 [Adiantum capillus-veneris]